MMALLYIFVGVVVGLFCLLVAEILVLAFTVVSLFIFKAPDFVWEPVTYVAGVVTAVAWGYGVSQILPMIFNQM